MRPLSKSKLLAYRQCPKRLWLKVNGPQQPEPDAQTQARFDDGHEVGELAQKHFDLKGNVDVMLPLRRQGQKVWQHFTGLADLAR